MTVDIDGLGPAVFCHASPRRDDEMLLVDSPVQRWEAALSGVDASIQAVVCGHTHMQFDRLAAGRRVINPGGVGMPHGPPGAHWALLGPAAWLRRTCYDTAAAAGVIAASRYPSAGEWAREYVLNHYSDTEASQHSPRSPASSKTRPLIPDLRGPVDHPRSVEHRPERRLLARPASAVPITERDLIPGVGRRQIAESGGSSLRRFVIREMVQNAQLGAS